MNRHARTLFVGIAASVVTLMAACAPMPAPTSSTTTTSSTSTTTSSTTSTTLPACVPGPVGSVPALGVGPVAAGFSSIWLNPGDDEVLRVDPGALSVAASITVGSPVFSDVVVDLDVDGANVVALTSNPGRLVAIDPATDTVTSIGNAPGFGPSSVAVDGTDYWVTVGSTGSSTPPFGPTGQSAVLRLRQTTPGTLAVVATVPVTGLASDVLVLDSGVWVATGDSITRIDPALNLAVSVTPSDATTLAADGSDIWAASRNSGLLRRFDPGSSTVLATARVGAPGFGPTALEVVGSRVWTAAPALFDPVTLAPTVGRGVIGVDRSTALVDRTIPLATAASQLAWDGAFLWASTNSGLVKTEIC